MYEIAAKFLPYGHGVNVLSEFGSVQKNLISMESVGTGT